MFTMENRAGYEGKYEIVHSFSLIKNKGYYVYIISQQSKEYLFNKQYHNDDGPGLIKPAYQVWCKHGQKHNLSGPALVHEDTDLNEYWIDGKEYDACTFYTITKKCFDCGKQFDNMADLLDHLKEKAIKAPKRDEIIIPTAKEEFDEQINYICNLLLK